MNRYHCIPLTCGAILALPFAFAATAPPAANELIQIQVCIDNYKKT